MTTQRIDLSNVTYQDLLEHPELLERLERQVRKERAAVAYQIFAPLMQGLTVERGTAGTGAAVHA